MSASPDWRGISDGGEVPSSARKRCKEFNIRQINCNSKIADKTLLLNVC